MATEFEIFIIHDDAQYAQQASLQAFIELDRLESELSRFIDNSDISRINNLKANQTIKIGLDTYACLKQCSHLYKKTAGAFDITIGALADLWKKSSPPSKDDLKLARKNIGMNLLRLDETNYTVTLLSDAINLNLGGYGKGYALDRMGELLREWDVKIALIHSGSSSVLALGAPPREKGWPLSVSNPSDYRENLSLIHLQNRSLSGSGVKKGKHIIDPRTGQPVEDKIAAWALSPIAATSDALSTAFMVMTPNEIEDFCQDNPDTGAMIIMKEEKSKGRILRFGCK